MALEAAFHELHQSAQRLHQASGQLKITFDDKPERGDYYVIQQFGDCVVGLSALSEEALAAASKGRRLAGSKGDPEELQRALALCHERLIAVERRLHRELNHYEPIKRLIGFSRRHGGEWPGWTETVRRDLEDCSR